MPLSAVAIDLLLASVSIPQPPMVVPAVWVFLRLLEQHSVGMKNVVYHHIVVDAFPLNLAVNSPHGRNTNSGLSTRDGRGYVYKVTTE